MRNPILTILAGLLALLFSSCRIASWQPGGTVHRAEDGAFTVQIPAGWMFFERPPGNVLATRDGFLLQQIVVSNRDLKEPFSFSKRTLAETLTPYEVAEALADDLRANHAMFGLEVIENKPAEVAGLRGFKLIVAYHTADHLRVREEFLGVIAKGRFYLLGFAAAERVYFPRDQATFERTAKTFTITRP